jgi:glycerophosphoryl diester phosphodiesterase
MVMHWLFLLAATAFWLAAAVGATPLRARGRLPVAVAHRGASGDAPENTMAAFRLAVDLGSAGFETDLHMTADGVVVLLHDSDIRRTTCGWPDDLPSYNIANLEWSFVSTLDAGSWFGPEFEGERVPLLQEGLDLARETGVLAYLDVKSSATGRAGLAAIERVLEQYRDIKEQVIVGVWSEGALADAVAVGLPELSSLSFIGSVPLAAAQYIRFRDELALRSLNINHALQSQPWVAGAQEAGLQVFAWTVNDPETIERMVNIGVDAIVTDFPSRVPIGG